MPHLGRRRVLCVFVCVCGGGGWVGVVVHVRLCVY